MKYSISNLKEVTDCIELLSWAERERSDLDIKRILDERFAVRFTGTAIEVEAILQGVTAELNALYIIIAGLPEGSVKEENIKKKTRLEYKKFLLETRKESYNTVALLEKEMDLGRLYQEIAEVDVFISAIQDQKTLLETQA